jgi:hypothetical protein
MSVLNQTSNGTPSVLIALVRGSLVLGAVSRKKLIDCVAPCSLGDNQAMATKTLNRWKDLGLFEEREEKTCLAEPYIGRLKRHQGTAAAVAQTALEIVLAERNNENFWDSDENRSADLVRATAWMLAQDVYAFQPRSHKEASPREQEQLPPKFVIFQNDTRWNGYKAWSEFLGFGRSDLGGGRHQIDPTQALSGMIRESIPPGEEIPLGDFVERLAKRAPVIDGGVYRRLVEERIRPGEWAKPLEDALSTSLSRTLVRLHEAHTIELRRKSDFGKVFRLIGREGREIRSVTHVAGRELL